MRNKTLLKLWVSFISLCAIAFFLSGCGGEAASSVVVTEPDLENLLSQGLPVILNFGDDSEDAQSTLAELEWAAEQLEGQAVIRSVDLAEKPEAKEGFPVQVIPTQFFYTAEGAPISLPGNLGIIMSSFVSSDTQQPVFTVHEGPLSRDDLLKILHYMGLAAVQQQ